MLTKSTIILYGGLLEIGDREVSLDDVWILDLKKRRDEGWGCLREDTSHQQVWIGDRSESECSGSVSGSARGGDKAVRESVDGTDTNLERINEVETLSEYFARTKLHWVKLVGGDGEDIDLENCTAQEKKERKEKKKKVKKEAFELAKALFEGGEEV